MTTDFEMRLNVDTTTTFNKISDFTNRFQNFFYVINLILIDFELFLSISFPEANKATKPFEKHVL